MKLSLPVSQLALFASISPNFDPIGFAANGSNAVIDERITSQ
jgi:hypothetical protein